MRVTVV
nr:ORF [Mus musculus]